MGFSDAYRQISDLVNDFKENEQHYLNPSYSEADVRNDFINKFFIALGWDVRHETQKNPYEQEVRVEKPVTVAKAQKRADYTFYLAPNFRDVKFFVEAKKPSHDLENKDYFFQTVRYGWNANTPIAVLTDFEEFIILDCRFRPDINDIINHKLKSFHYSDYADEEKLKEIYYLFSREAVADNSLEKFVDTLPKPRGKKKERVKAKYQNIDEAFLEELDEIRTRLAKSFKKSNSHLTSEELTEATQRTIDRLVFIRFLEDKMIEPHHYISEFVKPHPNPSPYKGEGLLDSLSLPRRGTKGEVEGRAVAVTAWEKFLRASRTLDAKYNGVVFKKSSVDSRNLVEPDDKTFSSICDELSHENSPYNFDAIPIHILGSIYERFLGKVVNATDKRVTIEEKPEVRKAGGVYYTPQYIVNYIVDNTVVKLVAGKSPKEIAKMRFADIACGSGSFLITVYERLIDYHKQWYQQHPEQAKKDGCVLFEGAYRLSLQQKQKILLNNIYGVDLDQQAVEVTQLSLYLKLLEDETTATANDTWVMFKEQLLPDLNKNIICGNSLIGTDILDLTLFPSPPTKSGSTTSQGEGLRERFDELKLKPMDFETVFPEVMRNGGFDAIVGNPPYVRIQTLNEIDPNAVKYFKREFVSAKKGNYDIYVLFIERSIELLCKKGELGYIVPSKFLTTEYGHGIRKIINDKALLQELVDFGHHQVFNNATTYTCLLFLKKNINKTFRYYKIGTEELTKNDRRFIEIDNSKLSVNTWSFFDKEDESLNQKLYINSTTLLELPSLISRGSSSGNDNIFCLVESNGKYYDRNGNAVDIEKEILRIPVYSTDFKRFVYLRQHNERIIFPYIEYNGKIDLMQENELKQKFPKALEYLQNNKKELLKRKQYKEWYSYSAARNLLVHENADLVIPLLADKGSFTLFPKDGKYCMMASGGFSISVLNKEYDHKYILGLINSTLLFWLLRKMSNKFRGGWITCTKQYFGNLPIKKIDFTNEYESLLYNKVISAVDQMLTTKKQLQQAKTDGDKNYLNRKCETLDRQIDELVYQLYGLTEEEIKIVEGKL